MALNLKNPEVERLAEEVARMTGETKTEAVRRALLERHQRLRYRLGGRGDMERVMSFLEEEVWPQVPPSQRSRRLSRQEEDKILGYGQHGA
ncbi:MAG: type II toxin-antitoxin system VapB family antitoxin [Acidimicrobiales bacterium]